MLLQMALLTFCSLLWVNNIPLYICTTYYLSIPLLMGIRLLPCLGCCKHAAMNIKVHVSFQIMVSLSICLGVGLLGHMVVLILDF